MKRTKKTRKRRSHRQQKEETMIRPSWVDRVQFEPVVAATASPQHSDNQQDKEESWISLISWNVLAHSYCSRASQRKLPPVYQKTVFHPHKRKKRILDILARFAAEEADILCLQEVDMEEIGDFFVKTLEWEGIETSRQKHAGSGVKLDSCVVYVNPEQWKICEHTVVTFDDLATVCSQIFHCSGFT